MVASESVIKIGMGDLWNQKTELGCHEGKDPCAMLKGGERKNVSEIAENGVHQMLVE